MGQEIPLFRLNYDKKEEEAVVDTLRSKWISTGPKCEQIEDFFSGRIGAKFGLSVTNCTSALHLAMLTAEIGTGDEVLVPSLSFVATANAVRYVGAEPVFCDIVSATDLTIDPNEIEQKITDRTRAIVPMHYGGFGSHMEKIKSIATKNNLTIIEDASHAPLSRYKEDYLGTIGDIGCFSFYSNKNISAGEGGMLVTDNEKYYEKAQLLRSHGMTSLAYERKERMNSYDVVELGYNYRMDDIRASLILVQMKKLAQQIDQLSQIRTYYEEALDDIDEIEVPFQDYGYTATNYIFPIIIKNSDAIKRDQIRQYLKKNGIQTSVHYPAIHNFSIYDHKNVDLSKTEYISENEISLPIFPSIEKSEIDYIADKLKEALCQ